MDFPQWDDTATAAMGDADLLVYRSNLLGSDKRITNYGGGNTSAKITEKDPLTGQDVSVLWVKGSGGDIGTMKHDGFATLYMDKLLGLQSHYRGVEFEDEMVGYLPHCTFNLNPRAASIDTPIHAFVPHTHVDHVHPDDIIAIATMKNGAAITAEIFGGDIAWLDWQRPGFELGLQVGKLASENPALKGVMLGGHGFVTWADTSKDCYEVTLDVIKRARAWLSAKPLANAFGGQAVVPLEDKERATIVGQVMPSLRGALSKTGLKVGHFDDSASVLEFVCAARLEELAALGTSCPDHFLRTKRKPLLLDWMPDDDLEGMIAGLPAALEAYAEDYTAYYERCKFDGAPALRDPMPVIVLMRGVGMFAFAANKATARIASEFYINAINVMRSAEAADTYIGLDEKEAFNIEYWLLEEAKLQRMPKPKPLAGRVAYVTGAAGGIGRAVAERLLADDACVFLTDIDGQRLTQVRDGLAAEYGKDFVAAAVCDVSDETQVVDSFAAAARAFGGVDIVVSNAGIASSAAFEETSLDMWNKNMTVMGTGYFLVSREGFKVMKAQGTGGAITFVASKNALAASAKAAAYCTAKASEVHLARCIAMDGAPFGIRCNVVNPDAVLSGSNIWDGGWGEQRAAAYGISVEKLPEFYKNRSMLKQSVLPADIAEAVAFLSTDASAKSTGNIINVDAGNAQSFTR